MTSIDNWIGGPKQFIYPIFLSISPSLFKGAVIWLFSTNNPRIALPCDCITALAYIIILWGVGSLLRHCLYNHIITVVLSPSHPGTVYHNNNARWPFFQWFSPSPNSPYRPILGWFGPATWLLGPPQSPTMLVFGVGSGMIALDFLFFGIFQSQ